MQERREKPEKGKRSLGERSVKEKLGKRPSGGKRKTKQVWRENRIGGT